MIFQEGIDGVVQGLAPVERQQDLDEMHEVSSSCGGFSIGTDYDIQQKTHDAEDQRRDKGMPEVCHVESTYKVGCQVEKKRVDHEGKEAQGENRNRQREENENRSQKGIEQPQNEGSDKDGNPVIEGHTADNVGNDEECRTVDDPFNHELFHRFLLEPS